MKSHRSLFAQAALALACAAACGKSSSAPAGPWQPGQPLTLDVSSTFPAGTALHDAYADKTATVAADGTVTLTPDANGLLLLEKAAATASAFSWQNATVYFVVTDRFFNGDTSNDAPYAGRRKDGAQEVGTWHGGDFAGLTQKLDYIASLGATAIWITPIVEQVHGWVAGGSTGDFRAYGYHGYWALDFTKIDANLGTPAQLTDFIAAAHGRGIRVLLDVVLNHPGYATGQDLINYLPGVFADTSGAGFQAYDAHPTGNPVNFNAWNNYVNYQSTKWANWWGVDWVRAGLGGGYTPGGTDPFTQSLSFLPDFKTEATTTVAAPPFFAQKLDTGVTALTNSTVRQYLLQWQTDWVRNYGFDGFRCDTVNNVEPAAFLALKNAAAPALAAWKAGAGAGSKIDDAPFWMVGEAFGHGVVKDGLYTNGFDALLNFDFQALVTNVLTASGGGTLAAGAAMLDLGYSVIAGKVSTDPAFNALSYISSHDTSLEFSNLGNSVVKQKQAGTALLMAPGAAQIFYGDESGRQFGPTASDPTQGTRSDMNFDANANADLLAHWQKVGAFRKKHVAVGAGVHAMLASPAGTYAFSRKQAASADAVVVVMATPAG